MGLLLEFLIAFFGVPWLIRQLTKGGKSRSNSLQAQMKQYKEELTVFSNRFEASHEEYKEVCRIVGDAYGDSAFLQRLIQSEVNEVFGPGTKLFENGKFSPKNERAFGKYAPDGILHAQGYNFIYMLLLAKRGKVPPYSEVGGMGYKFQIGFPEEERFLRVIERTLQQNNVPAKLVKLNEYNFYKFCRNIDEV